MQPLTKERAAMRLELLRTAVLHTLEALEKNDEAQYYLWLRETEEEMRRLDVDVLF
jgi:hypothetical protein